MGLVDYFGPIIAGIGKENHYSLLSFGGGNMIALLFLILVPDLTRDNPDHLTWLFMLLGFLGMHFAEKYLYKHEKDKKKLLLELKELHVVGFGLDNFLMGFIVASVLETQDELVFLIMIPSVVQMLASSIALEELDTRLNNNVSKILLAVMPVIGGFFTIIIEISADVKTIFLAIALGILFYMVVRDVIPIQGYGRPGMFILGNAIVIGIWVVIYFVVHA